MRRRVSPVDSDTVSARWRSLPDDMTAKFHTSDVVCCTRWLFHCYAISQGDKLSPRFGTLGGTDRVLIESSYSDYAGRI